MANRVLVGKRGSDDGLFISQKGVDVTDTSSTSPLCVVELFGAKDPCPFACITRPRTALESNASGDVLLVSVTSTPF